MINFFDCFVVKFKIKIYTNKIQINIIEQGQSDVYIIYMHIAKERINKYFF